MVSIGLTLFIAGVILAMSCWAFWLPEPLLYVACLLELAALVIGIISRRRPLGKITITSVVLTALFFGWIGQNGFPTYQRALHPTSDWMKPLDKTWVLQSPGKPYSIQVVSDLQKDGQDSLRFETRDGEAWVDQTFLSTYRSEIATKEFVPINSVQWYSFSLWLPTNFPAEEIWLSLAQWKYPENFSKGVSLKGLRPALRLGYSNGRFDITVQHSADAVIRDPENVPDERIFKKNKFPLGRWHDFVVQAKWSCKDDGFVNVWWNGKQVANYQGPVGYDMEKGPALKFGLYHAASEQTYVAYFSNVKSGQNRADVTQEK